MLDVALRNITLDERLHDISLTFGKSTHTAIVGPGGSGASTLLEVIAGNLKPSSGEIRFGTRDVTSLPLRRRPILYVTSRIDAWRWTVQHLLVAAVRERTLDRIDRRQEYELAVEKWKLNGLLDRRIRALSSSEATRVQLARIELMRPGIIVADRILESLNASVLAETSDEFYRTLRVMGATVISAPSSHAELGLTDRVIVLDRGRVVQDGSPASVYRRPTSEAAAKATGDVNVIPVSVSGDTIESAIGSWKAAAGFQGAGIALARLDDFAVAGAGEESDLIFGIEEASFRDGRWVATGILTGGVNLRVVLPADFGVHKGRLIPLRYDPARFVLLRAHPLQPINQF